jgi:Domain of unknown function (DUF4434)
VHDPDGDGGTDARPGEAYDALIGAVGTERPPIDGAFMFLGYGRSGSNLPTASVPRYMQELSGLGMHIVIVHATRRMEGSCSQGTFYWLAELPDKLETILDEAGKRGIAVYVGLDDTSAACPEFYRSDNAGQVTADVRDAMRMLSERYGLHPALAGWYIPDEPGLGWSTMTDYYRGIVAAVHESSSRPVLVSPYLAHAAEQFEPEQVADMAAAFRDATGIDVQVWQDSIGVDGPDLGWGATASLADYYAAISRRLGRNGLWALNELFNCCVPPFDGTAYRPTSLMRLNAQLFNASYSYVGQRIVWLEQFHMGTVDPTHYPESPRLAAAYRALYGLGGEYLKPVSYRWLTAPDDSYPDDGNKLFDTRVGDPRAPTNLQWVGVNNPTYAGRAQVEIILGARRKVDWVAAHLLHYEDWAIRFPDAMEVECSRGDDSWSSLGRWRLDLTKHNGEYVFSNPDPLNARCRALRVTFFNTGWTFVSELELIGE